MKLIVAAIAARPPAWVVAGWGDYAKRMPRELSLDLLEIKPEPRTTGKNATAMMAAEATRLDAALSPNCRRIVLDEQGDAVTTRQLSERLTQWMSGGYDVAFLIGGPDGLATRIKDSAHETLRLSSLTLPHALVRVILAEALYRAASVIKGHPYHRE
ncbi:MAG: 23S rRNA (pseudouridine(1915)-N(3))-methyltransferase RlmH [Rugosibacter sp.]|nr:23S rRNA (pseudouridine(1915)-N(3))-methyltransferase RlmH [Rugosibacter sp.]MDO9273047.1 23S rRNA (pseudouridine(1915)-N(3))-methyltransferase RlmH [Rugosibacter sp.]